MNIYSDLNKNKLICILRNIEPDNIDRLVDTLIRAGIKFIEIALNQSSIEKYNESLESIRILSDKYDRNIHIGAGTVLSTQQVEDVNAAGASYVISPNTNRDVIQVTKELNMISIPGAITPSEVVSAYEYGADFIKLFPAGTMGSKYFKDLATPLKHIPLLAVGGITLNNIKDFISAGAAGFGVSSGIINKSLLASGDYKKISTLAKEYVSIISS